MFEKLSLINKTAIVTGANRGIGYATAQLLKSRGAKVIATARSNADINRLNDQGFLAFKLDVSIKESIDNFKKEIKNSNITPNILVNNAGIGIMKLNLKLKRADWDKTMLTNLTSIFELTQAFLSPMSKRKWGRIINVSSVLSHFPQKGLAHYSASKAGLEGFSKGIALEYAHKGITVNCVAPGFIKTDMIDIMGKDGQELIKNQIPVQRMGSVEDVAELISFLASDASSYITGETIQINGGLYTN